MTTVARAERHQLCDLALEVGADAPTLCGDWDVKELVAHLLVRERSVLGAPGIIVPPLARLTDREIARTARSNLKTLVARLRKGHSLLGLPVIDPLVNTLEYFVHHEDIRRAQPGWEPRPLDSHTIGTLWRAITITGRGLVRPAGVPVVIRDIDTGKTATLRRGSDPVTITGMPSEIVMFLHGRRQTVGLELTGPQASIERLRDADLGI
jgi:uncharacterized protein (TIGR03085 family)